MALRPQRILSLCTGYGGLELGLEVAGLALSPLVYIEREVYAAANLVDRMEDKALPEAPIWDCVDTFNARPLHGVVDGVVGGYPCQPFSVAGRRQGTSDSRHLWPHFARIIRECEPSWCFFENVPNHLNIGFFEVARELQEMGYRVAATLVTAEEIGASHKRERLFILVYAIGEPLRFLAKWREQLEAERRNTKLDDDCTGLVAHSNGGGLRFEREPCKAQQPNTPRDIFDGRSGEAVADSNGEGQRSKLQPREQTTNGRTLPEGSCEVFPPGQDPSDPRWKDWPWPCVESEIRQYPDGHPHWVDELRLNGGGVVPLQAAYAFGLLAADLSLRSKS